MTFFILYDTYNMKLFSILSKSFIPIAPLNTLSNLEKIVVGRAIGSSVLSTITAEWSMDKIVIDLVSAHDNSWILSILIIYMYGYYKYDQMQFAGLDDVPVYDRWSKSIKSILFVVFMVFTKDIQNAI